MKFKKNMKDEFMENVYESIGCKNIAELSRHLEVDRSALSSILNGNKNCSNIYAYRLCKLASVKKRDYFCINGEE